MQHRRTETLSLFVGMYITDLQISIFIGGRIAKITNLQYINFHWWKICQSQLTCPEVCYVVTKNTNSALDRDWLFQTLHQNELNFHAFYFRNKIIKVLKILESGNILLSGIQ
jgi:hypothetical protein